MKPRALLNPGQVSIVLSKYALRCPMPSISTRFRGHPEPKALLQAGDFHTKRGSQQAKLASKRGLCPRHSRGGHQSVEIGKICRSSPNRLNNAEYRIVRQSFESLKILLSRPPTLRNSRCVPEPAFSRASKSFGDRSYLCADIQRRIIRSLAVAATTSRRKATVRYVKEASFKAFSTPIAQKQTVFITVSCDLLYQITHGIRGKTPRASPSLTASTRGWQCPVYPMTPYRSGTRHRYRHTRCNLARVTS